MRPIGYFTPSSSQVQDTGFSSRQHGFESRWGDPALCPTFAAPESWCVSAVCCISRGCPVLCFGLPFWSDRPIARTWDMRNSVRLFEVGPRDGLQSETTVVPTERKLALIAGLVDAGCRDIEVTSFVRPSWVPQLADADDLFGRLPRVSGIRYWCLTPNAIGLARAVAAGAVCVETVLSSSEHHNLRNLNRPIQASLDESKLLLARASEDRLETRAYISTAFGCPHDGERARHHAVELVPQLLNAGADLVVLADTSGVATPTTVSGSLRDLVISGVGLSRIAVHFHDTEGTALLNTFVAWQHGVRAFDVALGGIGGCPYAESAGGNAASEDVVGLFERMDVDTGIDIERLVGASQLVESLVGHPLPGRALAAAVQRLPEGPW
jgi:hydroxymethylglutaryl-CoA lyase